MATLLEWKTALVTAAATYDNKQMAKRGWNMYALGHYLAGINESLAEPDFLDNPRKAFANHFIIRGETGGIFHRNIPADLSKHSFVLPFVNSVLRKMKA